MRKFITSFKWDLPFDNFFSIFSALFSCLVLYTFLSLDRKIPVFTFESFLLHKYQTCPSQWYLRSKFYFYLQVLHQSWKKRYRNRIPLLGVTSNPSPPISYYKSSKLRLQSYAFNKFLPLLPHRSGSMFTLSPNSPLASRTLFASAQLIGNASA